jgi:hypothetical protein
MRFGHPPLPKLPPAQITVVAWRRVAIRSAVQHDEWRLHNAVIGPSVDIVQILSNIVSNPILLRLSVLGQIVTGSGVIVLAVMLYVVTRKYNHVVALIVLSCLVNGVVALLATRDGVGWTGP